MSRKDVGRYAKQGVGLVFIFLLGVTLAGCKCSDPKEKAEEQRQEDLARLPSGGGTLEDQLFAEAKARTGDTGSLDSLITSLTKEGVTFTAPKQGFGKKLLAIYCATADSTDGMIITVCEYPSPEQAKRGEAVAGLIGTKTAGFQSRVSKKSVLLVVARSDTPPEHVAKVLSTFDGL